MKHNDSKSKENASKKRKAEWIPAHKPIHIDKYENNDPFDYSIQVPVNAPQNSPANEPTTGSDISIGKYVLPLSFGTLLIIVFCVLIIFGLLYFSTFESSEVVIDSASGWHSTGVIIDNNAVLYVDHISGEWTVDAKIYEMVGSEGYSSSIDEQIWEPSVCKILNNAPYGSLLGRINDGPIFEIGKSNLIWFPSNGQLFLSINDAHECSWDNQGQITVGVITK